MACRETCIIFFAEEGEELVPSYIPLQCFTEDPRAICMGHFSLLNVCRVFLLLLLKDLAVTLYDT